MNSWTRTTATVAVAVLTAGAAACGAEPESVEDTGFAPVTIDHTYGATEITAQPETVVSISPGWTDALIALDVPITAEFAVEGYSGPGGRFEWTPEHESEIVLYGDISEQLEEIASYQPDIILAGYVSDEQAYQALSGIAPTIPVMDPDAVLDTWEDTAEAAGEIFGKQEQARAIIDDVAGQIAAFRAEHPDAEGRTFSFGQFTGDQYGLVSAATDPAAQLLSSFGLVLDPRAVAAADGADRVLVSLEQVDVLAADLLLMWPLGQASDLDTLAGWNDLPAVRNQTLLLVNNDNASAFAYPTVYSVPFALQMIRPAFENL